LRKNPHESLGICRSRNQKKKEKPPKGKKGKAHNVTKGRLPSIKVNRGKKKTKSRSGQRNNRAPPKQRQKGETKKNKRRKGRGGKGSLPRTQRTGNKENKDKREVQKLQKEKIKHPNASEG